MLTLFHHPFCPHSRFVRLALGEFGITARMAEERVWERRQEFLALNPDCTTPVLVEEGYPAIPGAGIIAEYLDETRGVEIGEQRLLPREPGPRVEVRRLMNWFNDKFFAEVSGPLTMERLYKRQMPVSSGGGSPDTEAIRAARHNMRYHLAYIGWLVRTRDWLAGPRMSYADLAAAAHLSAADFAANFDTAAYQQFLADVAGRGLKILITEMDVLDDGLPAENAARDQAVADAYKLYLDTALAEPAVASVITFGLTDRYTWLQEDYPREDGAPRRPLPFDEELQPKPAYDAVYSALEGASTRPPLWTPPRSRSRW